MFGKRLFWLLLTSLPLLVILLAGCAPAAEPVVEEPAAEIVVETVVETVVVEVEKEVEVEVEEPGAPEPVSEEPMEEPAPTATMQVQPTPPPASPTPAPTFLIPTPTPIIESRVVEVEWPERLHLGDSDVVRMALIPTKDGYTITTEFPDHETITQDVPVIRPTGYELYGVGRLDGVGFIIAPTGDQVRGLPMDEAVIWHWSLSPQQPGRQRITVTLLLRWVPATGSGGTTREAVAYSKGLEIQVSSFFGLTRGQAMRTGLIGAVFGGSLSLLALIYRPAAERKRTSVPLATREPNRQLTIECPSDVQLSSEDRSLLKSLFSRYARLVVQSEFLSGYSGARTYLLLPVRPDQRSDAYTIAKIGERSTIQREYQNYEDFVKHTLPPVTARIQNPPITVHNSSRAALQYTFIGEAGTRPLSLRQALLENPNPALLSRLFEIFGPNWWMQRKPYTFCLAKEYDRLLPPHYMLEPDSGAAYRSRGGKVIDGRTTPGETRLSIGDRVTLRNFPVVERRIDGTSTSIKGESVPGHPRLRVRWLGLPRSKRLNGCVVATRDDLLKSYVAGFDLFGWPDPLAALPHLLGETLIATRSIVHGDLNLENVLVGPGDFVWLIDFATTRESHSLLDFAHLEAEIIAHVIAPNLSPREYQGLLESQDSGDGASRKLYEFIALRHTVFQIAAKCLANPSQPREYHLALYLSCLGALKYRNLDAHQKHLLYLTAASLLARI